MRRAAVVILITLTAITLAACQNPSSASSSTTSYTEAVDISADPNPIVADSNTGGKTYRVVRGNNQPDEMLAYDWHALFSTTLSTTSASQKDELDLDYPIRITAATLQVRQATGGIITPPSGSDKETYEYIPLNATANSFSGVGSSITISFEAWYDLPSLRKEGVITVLFTFVDNDGTSFQRSLDFNIAP
jgi:hypothetical protein